MRWTCSPCDGREYEFNGLDEVAAHLAEHGHEVDRWPDGAPVVVDMTLDPSEFKEGETP